MPLRIYLDYAATSPMDPEVAKAMEPYSQKVFGNASSVHSFGQQAAKATDEARVTIAQFLNCQPTEVVFTSGATESNNIAIKGVVFDWIKTKLQAPNSKFQINSKIQTPNSKQISNYHTPLSEMPHIVTTSIEHPSVLEVCRSLEQMGLAEVTYVRPQPNGVVAVEDIVSAIKDNTVLVSVMYANNEIGTIQPIREIGREIAKLNDLRSQPRHDIAFKQKFPVLFHTDATQAVQFLNCRVDKLGVDLLSMSAHKIYGPKGMGALYIKKNTPIARLLDGGSQEFDHRAGTLNTAGVVGMGKAVELLALGRSHSEPILSPSSDGSGSARSTDLSLADGGGTMPDRSVRASSVGSRLASLRDNLIDGILTNITETSLNGDPTNRLPNNVNIRFNGVDGQTLVMALDQLGIAASSGSACASGAPRPSHVITAMFDEQSAKESVRLTIGKWTSPTDIEKTIGSIVKIVQKMRSK